MLNPRMDDVEEQEGGFHSYPCAYYVQSPSTISHANSADIRNINNESPPRSETFLANGAPPNPNHVEASRFTLSRYSSRGSNNSFLHEKKVPYDARSHGTGTENGENPLIVVDGGVLLGGDDEEDDDDDKEYYGRKRGCWRRYCTYRNSDSCVWICLQICWRALVSLGVALIVFYLVTKPPPPNVSVKIAGIGQFVLGEGVDASGVSTKILTCNCSIDLVTENKSKLFGLHIHPLILEMSFGRLPFAMSYSPKLFAERGSTLYKLSVGTRNKPMYGGGRSMQDMLESGRGLPLVIRMSMSSSFRVVWNLVRPKFHHQAECLLVLHRAYDKKHRTQAYNSSCTITS
ncbi:uncharacterized protein LOC132167740 [Corylus avellana]|uniref:uncharacterized protein LOC132167740 n=1 Tax=Corylus avellana TaxID=13451 RepID=UPI00286C96AE|nr:uncharacterized protein LOC132167740 [Corylus avellana]